MDRRDHRDVDIARLAVEQLCGRLLAAGRHRIDVEIIGIAAQVRLDRLGGLKARGRRHRRNHHVGIGDRVGRRTRQPDAEFLAGRFQLRPGRFRKQDVPGRNLLDAGVAQAGGDRLAGFAEANEGNARGIAAGHGRCRPWTFRWNFAGTIKCFGAGVCRSAAVRACPTVPHGSAAERRGRARRSRHGVSSRSSAARLSSTWAICVAFGMTMTSSCRISQASATWAGVALWRAAIAASAGWPSKRPCSIGE